MTSHTGNIMPVVSDLRKPIEDPLNPGTISHYEANVKQAVDRYPGGWPLPGRTFYSGELYRYGAGGHENLNEITGNEASTDAHFAARPVARRMRAYPTNPEFLILVGCPKNIK
ncbi:MAG: hypothetical protein WD048_07025 [Chitinophagales bacterium]